MNAEQMIRDLEEEKAILSLRVDSIRAAIGSLALLTGKPTNGTTNGNGTPAKPSAPSQQMLRIPSGAMATRLQTQLQRDPTKWWTARELVDRLHPGLTGIRATRLVIQAHGVLRTMPVVYRKERVPDHNGASKFYQWRGGRGKARRVHA